MKEYRNILITFALVLICNLGFSNTTEGKQVPAGQEQEGNRKSSQTIINPEGDEMGASQQENFSQDEENIEPEDSDEIFSSEEKIEKDSVEDGSVSKYNFIFYLLYKFKYDTAP